MQRMSRDTFRLVMLVSCAHALVHVYELSFGNIELLVGQDFGVDKQVTGMIATCLRLPFGLGAFAAGWMADRFGAKRLLLIYLIGCSAACLLAWYSLTVGLLVVAMFSLGMFASIYHPAGVGLISHHTTAYNRPMALGYHGIFGSVGIALGPFLAAVALSMGLSWRGYYLVLALPGVLLALLIARRLAHAPVTHDEPSGVDEAAEPSAAAAPTDPHDEDHTDWFSYGMLIVTVSIAGIVYAGILTFLPRYLHETPLAQNVDPARFFDWLGLSGNGDAAALGMANLLTSFVLLLGVIGQYTAGRLARPHTLEPLMAAAFLMATPCVFWMGWAGGNNRVLAAGLFATLFFMHQPLFNSLVAKYTPRRRRSLAYGLSFTMGFGVGSFGPTLSGMMQQTWANFTLLGTLLAISTTMAGLLWWRGRNESPG